MPDTYPFPGCCEHTSNAHSRKHCLLCDCEKPPAAPPQPVKVQDAAAELTELQECGVCHAAVIDRERHLDWHERIIRTMENLASAIAGVRPKVYRNTPPEEEK